MFGELELKLDMQLKRALKAEAWDELKGPQWWNHFLTLLEEGLDQVKRLSSKSYDLQDRLPSQEFYFKVQHLNERLTDLYYGQPNINMAYRFLIETHHHAGVTGYLPEAMLHTNIMSEDGALYIMDGSVREDGEMRRKHSQKMSDNLQNRQSAHLSHGKNALDKNFFQSILTAAQHKNFRQRSGLLSVGLTILNRRKGVEHWGQVSKEIRRLWLSQIPEPQENLDSKAVKLALYYQKSPSMPLYSPEEDRQIIEDGLRSGELVKVSAMTLQNQFPGRYLRFSFQREMDFCDLDSKGEGVIRPKGSHEFHRVITNSFPYGEKHGLVLAGRADSYLDTLANQPNTRLDLEKLLTMIRLFNPPPNRIPLHGESFFVAFQNPLAVSSIPETEHMHLLELPDPELQYLKDKKKEIYSDHLSLIQVGTVPDAIILDYLIDSALEPESISKLVIDLRSHYKGIDFFTASLKQGQAFHLFLMPLAPLKMDNQLKFFFKEGEKNLCRAAQYAYGSFPTQFLGMHRCEYKGGLEQEVSKLGGLLISEMADFGAVPGITDFLQKYFHKVPCQSRPEKVKY